jgi:predicted SAM-dependent methyltransferase
MKNTNIKTLDVGCGATKIKGAIGIDQFGLQNVDIVHDLNVLPWPIEGNSIDHIIFSHSISHLRNICGVMGECDRILKRGGVIEIVAPHFSSDNFFTDPTHVFSMGYRSMSYFVDNIPFGYRYMDEQKLFIQENSYISFREASASWRTSPKFNILKFLLIENFFNMVPRFYEKFLSSVIPASEVYFLLRKKVDLESPINAGG